MTNPDEIVAGIISAAGGAVTGRVRLQKVAYLLQQLGLGTDLRFRYHHYGPYSRTLDDAIDHAKAFRGVKEIIEYRKSDGLPYSVFHCEGDDVAAVGEISGPEAVRVIRSLKNQPSTVLELAATIHWLQNVEQVADWRDELRKRKGAKAQRGRVETALRLLTEIGLADSAPSALI